MDAVLVNATASLQFNDRIPHFSTGATSFRGRHLAVGRTRRQWSDGVLRCSQGGVVEAAADQKELDKQRAAMREWWMGQLAAKNGSVKGIATKAPVDQNELDKQRAAMREWWIAQLAAKNGAVKSTVTTVDQTELDKQRAAMRDWWMGQLAAKSGAVVSTATTVDQEELDKQRAAMREWWLAKLAAKNGTKVEEVKSEAKAVSSASKKVVAAKVEVSKSVEQETIEKELERERAKREARQAEGKRTQQKVLDKGRKEMRDWWLAKYEAKKRSLGWAPYEPCWIISPAEGSVATESYELTGEGVIVGAVPQTSYDEKPAVIDLPVVSSNHAKVYGKDVVAGYGKLTREYFVRDLGSTNGTYLNNLKLRPKTDVKLSPGDVLRFSNEKVTFVVKKGERP
eukprot:TRINITY_DN2091_c0_g1_i1.p1 TRINITY_DN2091_c0_g1~~TRINITY_DN2091_c0_g1_i1.p1  ORF type:complete len:410 (+),score=92.85 TRINITY_DN2091_c0_g1_i1:42-1232(+)